jgi:hypothetical protein
LYNAKLAAPGSFMVDSTQKTRTRRSFKWP